MKLLFAISFLISAFVAKGQADVEFKECFESRSLSKLVQLEKKWRSEKRKQKIHLHSFTDIVADFSGGILWVADEQSYGFSEGMDIFLICKGDSIISYQFSHLFDEDTSVMSKYFQNINPSYSNKKAERQLQYEFKNIFKNGFMDSIFFAHHTFGAMCGFGGINPSEMDSMLLFVQNSDNKSIDRWLCSSNTALQIYGLYGLYLMERNGKTLSEDEKKWKQLISAKVGEINVCQGCVTRAFKIKDVINSFKNLAH
jgi:hypothetical protein